MVDVRMIVYRSIFKKIYKKRELKPDKGMTLKKRSSAKATEESYDLKLYLHTK